MRRGPKPKPHRHVHIRMADEVFDLLAECCEAEDRTMTDVIEDALRGYVKRRMR